MFTPFRSVKCLLPVCRHFDELSIYLDCKIFAKEFAACVYWNNLIFVLKHYQCELYRVSFFQISQMSTSCSPTLYLNCLYIGTIKFSLNAYWNYSIFDPEYYQGELFLSPLFMSVIYLLPVFWHFELSVCPSCKMFVKDFWAHIYWNDLIFVLEHHQDELYCVSTFHVRHMSASRLVGASATHGHVFPCFRYFYLIR